MMTSSPWASWQPRCSTKLIIKEDDDTRGRPRGDAAKWITHGVEEVANQVSYRTILDETEAIETALDEAPEGGLVVILPESVTRSINLINARKSFAGPADYRDSPRRRSKGGGRDCRGIDKFGLRPICRSSPVNLRSGQTSDRDILSNFPSWEGCPEGGVGQIYELQIPHLPRIKRLNTGINPPLPLPGGDSCSEISTVVPYLELRSPVKESSLGANAIRPYKLWNLSKISALSKKRGSLNVETPSLCFIWWRGMDLNHGPSGYEPDELPDCSTPRRCLV